MSPSSPIPVPLALKMKDPQVFGECPLATSIPINVNLYPLLTSHLGPLLPYQNRHHYLYIQISSLCSSLSKTFGTTALTERKGTPYPISCNHKRKTPPLILPSCSSHPGSLCPANCHVLVPIPAPFYSSTPCLPHLSILTPQSLRKPKEGYGPSCMFIVCSFPPNWLLLEVV